jgi:tRNA threonylcarbamoyladenosine biosynthesis protein TsaE
MNKPLSFRLQTDSPEATEAVAEIIGKNLRGGEVIELTSDLGGGKTTFVRGLARGFGSPDRVSSPTFTISKVYKSGDRELHHFDFYRLPEAGLIAHELAEVIDDPSCAVVIEWGEIVQGVLPKERLTIAITKTNSEAGRNLAMTCSAKFDYLMKGVETT